MPTAVSSKEERWIEGPWILPAIYGLTCALAVTYVFRHLFFGLTSGDTGDARIAMTLFEHWRTVILGRAADWRSPIFFFPKQGVLGNTDAFALFALPYTIARLKFDEFLSYDLSLATMFVAGFVSMALLLRDGLRLSHPMTLMGSVLFTVFGSIYQRTFHAQLLAVEIVPLMIWLAIAFARSTSTRQSSFIAASGAVVFGATCLTGFYICWFFILLIAWAVIVANGIYGPPSMLRKALILAKAKRVGFIVFGACLLAALYPFLSLYLPRFVESGPQPLSEAFGEGRSQHVWDLVAVGSNNFVWGNLLGHGGLGGRLSWNPSITPVVGVAMLCTVVASFVCFRVGDLSADECTRVHFVRVLGVAALLLLLSFVDWGAFRPFIFYYQFVPGGSATRVPARITLLFPAIWVPIIMIGAFWTWQRAKRLRWVVLIVIGMMLVEQHAARLQAHTDVFVERQRLGVYRRPPESCSSFYVTGWIRRPEESTLIEFFYGPHVDAMILAYRFRVPTLNGNSTVLPPGWKNGSPIEPQYLGNMAEWISRNNLSNVCRLNLDTAEWSRH
jgi:hypothetical protein